MLKKKEYPAGARASGRPVAATAFDLTTATPDAGWAERRFWRVLGLICLVALVCRLAILVEYTARNPLSAAPLNDAQTYWDWANRVAEGQLVQDRPFFSAPLYPYALGLIRAGGGSLRIVYLLQILGDLATAGLLACAARARFGARVGLLSATLFLLLQEPLSFSLRILTCSLQLFLLALTYLLALRAQHVMTAAQQPPAQRAKERRTGLSTADHAKVISWLPARYAPALLGVALGLLSLSYAPAALLAVLIVPWLFWQSTRTGRDGLRAVTPLAVAALLIAPATLHNWHASGNFFLIQSVTAVNLRQGNQPDSHGVYTPIPGTTIGREWLFDDASREYELATGRHGTWAEIDRFNRDLVRKFWLDDPLRAIKLATRKLCYFLFARDYGDIYQPQAELRAGVDRLFWLTPLLVPWLIGPALVGLLLLGRRPVRYAPELLIFLIPLVVVVVHWYSPRYRLPAIPAIVVVAAWAIERALRWRSQRVFAIAVAGALGIEMLLGPIIRAAGFDICDPAGEMFHMAYALTLQKKPQDATEMYRRGLEIRDDPLARTDFGDVLFNLGRPDEALAEYERARALAPDHPDILGRVATMLVQQQRLPEARIAIERALPRDPRNPVLLRTAAACYQRLVRQNPNDTAAREALMWVDQQLKAVQPPRQP